MWFMFMDIEMHFNLSIIIFLAIEREAKRRRKVAITTTVNRRFELQWTNEYKTPHRACAKIVVIRHGAMIFHSIRCALRTLAVFFFI